MKKEVKRNKRKSSKLSEKKENYNGLEYWKRIPSNRDERKSKKKNSSEEENLKLSSAVEILLKE